MSNAPVLFKTKGNIAQITLNRPDNRNSMNDETMPAFSEAVSRAEEDKNGHNCRNNYGRIGNEWF